jgi:uncharacterized protein (DUF983 family)
MIAPDDIVYLAQITKSGVCPRCHREGGLGLGHNYAFCRLCNAIYRRNRPDDIDIYFAIRDRVKNIELSNKNWRERYGRH